MNEQASQQYPQTYINPYNMGSHAQSIVQMTDTRAEVEQLKLSLECCEIIDDRKVHYGDPLMNDFGVNSIMGQIKSLVHRITIMSNLDENEISKMMMSFSDSLIMDLMIHRYDYAIKQCYDRTKIIRMCQSVAYTCIKRAIYGDDKKMWSKIQSDSTNTLIQQGAQSQPWYRKMNPFK